MCKHSVCGYSVGSTVHLAANSLPVGRWLYSDSVDAGAWGYTVLHDYSRFLKHGLKKEPSHTLQLRELLNDWPST